MIASLKDSASARESISAPAGSAIRMVLLLACAIFFAIPSGSAQADPPNIIFIFIDDLGYGDLTSYGNADVNTAHIDRLAEEGVRFTRFYANAPICSPSRVAVTTGTYPQRWDIHSFLASSEKNRRRGMADYLSPEAPSLARILSESGYATAHFGKWHMGGGRDIGDAPFPTDYGFDESLVAFEGLGDRFLWPSDLSRQSAELGRGRIEWTEKHEMTRIYVDRAIDFITRHRNDLFYINLWPNDVHDPHIPSPRPGLLSKYEGTAESDYEQKFFAVLDEMDRQIGRLLNELDRLDLTEETIVILAGDNGPTDWPHYYREGGEPPGSSGPYRGRKWSLYEGGIRVPFLLRWPEHVRGGRVDETTVLSGIDLPPTLLALAGLESAVEFDGENLSTAFLDGPRPRETPLFWYYPNDLTPGNSEFVTPMLAMRSGPWKLLADPDGEAAELYNLVKDPRERRNVAADHPDIRDRLFERMKAWYRDVTSNED